MGVTILHLIRYSFVFDLKIDFFDHSFIRSFCRIDQFWNFIWSCCLFYGFVHESLEFVIIRWNYLFYLIS